jgi:hypothetical protein
MQPELGRDATVAIVLIAAIIGLMTGSIMLGAAALAVAAALIGAVVLIRSRLVSPRGAAGARSRLAAPSSAAAPGSRTH